MSYRDCKAAAEAPPACAPLRLPSRRPLPPPMAAPAAGLPVTAPMSAPAAAPMTVPIAPLATALWAPASAGSIPVWDRANCRHSISSAWKTSKGFPGAGNTMTFGPLGTVTQALSTPTPSSTIPHLTNIPLLLTMAACGYPTATPHSLVAHTTRYGLDYCTMPTISCPYGGRGQVVLFYSRCRAYALHRLVSASAPCLPPSIYCNTPWCNVHSCARRRQRWL